jgi:hypothetical protein
MREALRPVVGLLILNIAIGTGCRARPTLPELHPVHGRVVDGGGKPLSGATIQFQPEADSTVSTTGTADADGRFELSSFKAGIRAPGAVAGPNRVLVTPAAGSGRRPTPVVLPESCLIKPGENAPTLVVQ